MSRVPTGKFCFTSAESREARRCARGTPRVRMPIRASCARSFCFSAISWAIRSIMRRMRSGSRILALRVSSSVKPRESTGRIPLRQERPEKPASDGPNGGKMQATNAKANMVIYNAATRELTAKIVYYGPGLCGKTTNLKVLHDRLEPGTAGKLLNLQTQTDRTIYFDLLPVELGDIKGYKIRFQLATVPGQTAFNETRRVVLKGVDGIVFVADSQWTMLPKNLESWQNLKDNLKSNEISFEKIPVVVQYNKRDLADILAVDAMQDPLGRSSYP